MKSQFEMSDEEKVMHQYKRMIEYLKETGQTDQFVTYMVLKDVEELKGEKK